MGLSEDELAVIRGSNIGIVFQSFHLVPTMTALENVALPLEFAGKADAFETRRRPAGRGRPGASRRSFSGAALGRRAAARRHRPRAQPPPADHPRRRADRQPRRQDRRAGDRSAVRPAAAPAGDPRARHARPRARRALRPPGAHGRRRDRRRGAGPRMTVAVSELGARRAARQAAAGAQPGAARAAQRPAGASTCSSPAWRWASPSSPASARWPMRCARASSARARRCWAATSRCRVRTRPAEGEERAWLWKQGRVSETATMRAMARRPDGSEQALVELKGVDAAYPLVGGVQLSGGSSLDEAIRREPGAAIDPVLLERLGLKVGDRLSLGTIEVPIRATIAGRARQAHRAPHRRPARAGLAGHAAARRADRSGQPGRLALCAQARRAPTGSRTAGSSLSASASSRRCPRAASPCATGAIPPRRSRARSSGCASS